MYPCPTPGTYVLTAKAVCVEDWLLSPSAIADLVQLLAASCPDIVYGEIDY